MHGYMYGAPVHQEQVHQVGCVSCKNCMRTCVCGCVCAQEARDRLDALFTWLVDPCLAFIRKNCKETVPTSDINLPVSLMSIVWSLYDEFRDAKAAVPAKDVLKIVEGTFLFALIWSIGGSVGA